jgi:hypothetical protein
MSKTQTQQVFTPEVMKSLFPKNRTDDFFEALFGDAVEGAYDIALAFKGATKNELHFEFQLTSRPGKCLACNLTYGLPGLFSRHPIINIEGVVRDVCEILGEQRATTLWKLGQTREVSRALHVIPLVLSFNGSAI